MARTRSKRRRQNIGVIVALALTISIVTLAHDVNRLSAESNANRASIDRTFASLATTLMFDEDHYGTAIANLMAQGAAMNRVQFASSVLALVDEGHALRQRAAILAHPNVAGGVQSALIAVTNTRVRASEQLLETVSSDLSLPGVAHAMGSLSALGQQLRRADALWAHQREGFIHQPGHARLPRSVFALSAAPLASERAALQSSATLAVHRSLTIDAVSVSPAPLPAPSGHWILLASSATSIGVAVHNQAFAIQNFVIHLAITSAHSPALSMQYVARVGPFASVATTFSSLVFSPGEHASVKIWLSGAPVGTHAVGVRHYQVVVAQSPST